MANNNQKDSPNSYSLKISTSNFIAVLFLLILIIYYVYVSLIEPATTNLNNCVKKSNSETYKMLNKILKDTKYADEFCIKSNDTLLSLKSCIQNVNNKNLLGTFVYEKSGIQKNVQLMIGTHNQNCTQYKILPVD